MIKNMKPDIRKLTRAELEAALTALGEKPSHAAAVFLAVHRRGAADLAALPGVPARVCAALAPAFSVSPLTAPERLQVSRDGTRKLLLRFADGAPAECVVLPAKGRLAACLSSQSGCACGCTFCATGALGLKRSLTAPEIIAQFEACLKEAGELSSLVFMGMGEPFLNWDNVKRAILILSDSRGRHFPQAKITVSTVGVISVIEELAAADLKVRLAVSLVAADEELRARRAHGKGLSVARRAGRCAPLLPGPPGARDVRIYPFPRHQRPARGLGAAGRADTRHPLPCQPDPL
jgi:23S rRNA (adenine2503-C2)-methyltransferase